MDQSIENYSDKCRKAFEEPSNIGKDLYDALHYRKGDQTASQYFKKIHRLADNIIRHDLSKENLLSFLLQNSIDNIDMKKEIKIRGATKSEEIEEIIKKMETIEKELKIESNVAAMRTEQKTYDKAAQIQGVYSSKPIQFSERENNNKTRNYSNMNYSNQTYQQKPRQRFQNYENRPRQSRYDPTIIKRCWACKAEGHVRTECPNIQCSQCQKPGHFRHQCYEINEPRRDYSRFHRDYNSRFNRDQNSRFNRDQPAYLTEDDEIGQYPNASLPQREEVIGAIH